MGRNGKGKIQWHPAFYGAAELELRQNKDDLEFEREYNLSKEPLRTDLLIIKKRADAEIKNEIGHIFKRFNIIEYKSPDDGISIDDYYKTIGYACLYKGLGETVNAVPADELTITIVREAYPREMMKHLRQQGATIEEKYPGIYYVRGIVSFDTQVVVTSKLEPGLHSSLRILSKNVQEKDIRLFLAETNNLKQPGEIDNINAVLQASVNANVLVYNQVREELGMCDALRDLFKDELEESFNKGEESGRRSAIANMLRNGKTVAQIADFGGFSIEEVREVENEMLEAAK